MNDRGFALIVVLWLIAALSVFTGGAIAAARLDIEAAQNRIALERAEWAAEACLAILHRRYAQDRATRSTDTVRLGSSAWCHARGEDPSSRLNVNAADEQTLRRFFQELPTDTMPNRGGRRDARDLDFTSLPRPLAAVAQLRTVDGLDVDLLRERSPLLTVRGDGRVNLMTANPRVVRSLSMLTHPQADRILAWRSTGAAGRDHAAIAMVLEDAGVPLSATAYRSFVQRTILAPTVLVVDVTGGLDARAIRGTRTVTVIPVGDRLAVVRREVP